ncbi:PPW family C-terminal domain-containing PPE protein [Mycobacterium sp. Marseille-P9652]|uniref:PPW family C-terminal domain-containing PPE protein n=1 Tax=Mycobacterium sp. Marseille-P9652 TaxID=2654950 RepID=UPI0018D0767B|nr:hypothetical protein [Mycobacterium sp. Marseille-P9652]
MGVDLLREHLRALAVQPRRKRLARNVTPHPCIVAHRRSGRKEVAREPKVPRNERGAGRIGFAGVTGESGGAPAVGLRTLGGGGPVLPMLPSGWAEGPPRA